MPGIDTGAANTVVNPKQRKFQLWWSLPSKRGQIRGKALRNKRTVTSVVRQRHGL